MLAARLVVASSAFSAWMSAQPAVAELQPDAGGAGVVVEQVTTGFEAARAGLQEGDLILRWARGDAGGAVGSPFDMSWLEVEQAPRGAVTLEGRRGPEPRTWTVGEGQWGLRTRPDLPDAAEADPRSRVWRMWRAAESLAAAGQWDDAQKLYQDATGNAASSDPAARIAIRLAWAAAAFSRGDLEVAAAQYQHAVDSEGEQAETLMRARAITGLASVAWNQGDLGAAAARYRQALAIGERLAPGSLVVAGSHVGLGHVMSELADLPRAEAHYGQALAIQEKRAPGSMEAARSLGGLGNVAFDRGDLSAAEGYYTQALAIRERLAPGGNEVALCLAGLGNVAEGRGNLVGAEGHYRRALAIIERLAPDSVNVAVLANNLGFVAERRGELEAAEDHYRRALAIDEKRAPDSLLVAGVLNNLASVSHRRGDDAKAEEYYRRCLALQEKLAPTSLQQADTLNKLGRLFADRGRLAEAEDHHRRALTMAEGIAPDGRVAAESLQHVGDVLRQRGDLSQAETHYRRALAWWERQAPGSADYAETLAALAGILRRTGRADAAEEAYEQALRALESQTTRLGGAFEVRSGYRAQHAAKYRDYVDLLIERRQPERAFQVLERSRARTLLEMLAEGGVDVRRGAAPDLLQRERALQELIEAKADRRLRLLDEKGSDRARRDLERELEELFVRYREVQGELRARSPGYAALTQPPPLRLTEVQALLGLDTVLLQYAVGEEKSLLFVVAAGAISSAELPGRPEIERLARQLHDGLRARGLRPAMEKAAARRARLEGAEAATEAALRALGPLLLGPARSAIEGKRLVIVADGILHYVPFAALPDPAATTLPLIAAHEVLNLPSASVLALLRQQAASRTPPRKAVAVLADPVFDEKDVRVRAKGSGAILRTPLSPPDRLTRSLADVGLPSEGALRRLPFTRQEAMAIRAAARPEEVLEALDFQASRARATSPELADYRVLHLATHGILNGEHPELSGLVLSLVDEHGAPDNGFLGLEDIYNLNLPVELVVLSACVTGLGREVTGEGLIGLTRGFMYAGATRVVASLWNVDDWATAELMDRFYTGMERRGLRPAAALRQAQLEMRQERRWASPYYWAAFEIQGDWK